MASERILIPGPHLPAGQSVSVAPVARAACSCCAEASSESGYYAPSRHVGLGGLVGAGGSDGAVL